MLQITEKEVQDRISPEAALEAVRAAHRDLALGKAQNVVRARARANGFTLHSLPSLSTALGLSAIKVYTSIGGMKASHLLMYSLDSGEVLAMIEAKELGRLRTAAVAVLGAELLSNSSLGRVLVIGTGYQGGGVVRALGAERTRLGVESITLSSRNSETGQKQAKILSALYGLDVCYTQNIREGFETIFTATTASTPVLTQEDLFSESGELVTKQVVALGSNSLIRRELHGKLVTGAARIIVDDREVSKVESGNLLPLIESGFLHWNQLSELGDILRMTPVKTAAVKTGAEETGYSLFLTHGMGIQDLYLGALLLK